MKNKFWIFMFNRRQYQIMPSSSLSYHQYTCSQLTLYECYVDGKLLIHKPSALLYSTRFYQYLQRLWIFLLLTSSSIPTPRPQPACLIQCYRDIQLKVELGQSMSGSMVSVSKRVVVSDALKDTFVELKILMTISHGSCFFALSIGYTTIKKWHIGRIWSPGILRIRSACALPFLECLANPLNLWKRRPSPLQIFLTCSLPK